jgi:acyl carrier protein
VSDRRTIEGTVLDIVEGLVAELRGTPARSTVSLDASLDRDLGLGSLERVELLLRLQQAFGVLLPDASMEEAETPRAIADAVRSAGPVTAPIVLEPPAPAAPGMPAPASLRTLTDVLRWHAEADPGRVHMFLQEADGRERPITYGELRARAVAVAAGLSARGVRRGDAIGLMLRTEEDFFYAFFGTLLAGGVPVPIYPPARLDRLAEYAQRQAGILKNAEAHVLITFRQAERVAGALAARLPSLREVTVVERLAVPGAEAPAIRPVSEDAALIQYTSGSTGEPKGVLLSHANIMANSRAIACGIAIGSDDVAVSWLPLYHDMGLIGSWLTTLSFGIPIVILSPLAFLARPARWLWALHTLGYTGYVGVLLLLTLPALWAPGRAVARLVRAWCRLVLQLGGCPLRVEGLETCRPPGRRCSPPIMRATSMSSRCRRPYPRTSASSPSGSSSRPR